MNASPVDLHDRSRSHWYSDQNSRESANRCSFAELLPGFPTQFFTERGDGRLESALIPTPPQRLTSQHFSMRPFTPDRSRSDDLFELSRSDIAVRFGATRRELDLQTVPTLVPDNAVNRNSSEVIARF